MNVRQNSEDNCTPKNAACPGLPRVLRRGGAILPSVPPRGRVRRLLLRVLPTTPRRRADACAFIEPVKARLFPETFEYVYKGLDGVETTTTQVLFGDLVAAVEETIDYDSVEDSGTKDFKPGTNAQRHRLQQGPGRSSRLADLTSMVRESFRASFRRVNESSTDEPAASSAKLPADHRRLSWRASAPNYGTL